MAICWALAWACALGAIALESWRRHPAFYLLKPAATLLFGLSAALAPWASAAYAHWILAALGLCLAGDALLMAEGERAFLAGLVAFLLAHGAFVIAFLQGVAPALPPALVLAALLLPAGAMGMVLLPRAGRLALPVLVYQGVLVAMVVTAWMRWHALAPPCGASGCEDWLGALRAGPARAGADVLVGALLFLVSDACLGVRQFVRPYRGDQALILGLYWSAISLLAGSVAAA